MNSANELRAGTARRDITPKGPISMGGYGQRVGQLSQGVHDPLFAKALWLSNGMSRLLVITTDLISMPDTVANRVVEQLAARGVANEAEICITASHTHSGPDVEEGVIFADVTREYTERLVNAIIEAASQAAKNTFQASLKIATGQADFLINRRRKDRRDLVDSRVLVVAVHDRERGQDAAVLFGVGCHPVCLGHDNMLISADYPGIAQVSIEQALGVENALFVNLTEGNVIPLTRELFNSLDTRGYLGGTFADSEKVGGALAAEVIRLVRETPVTPVTHLRVQKDNFLVKPNGYSLRKLDAFREMLRQRRILLEYLPSFRKAAPWNFQPVLTLWRDASEVVITRQMDETEMRRLMSAVSIFLVMASKLLVSKYQKPIRISVQRIELNEYRLMTLPGEVLVEVGLDWQKRNHPNEEKAFIIGLANGFMGYLPHPENFKEPGAQYKYETIMNALEPDATVIALDHAEALKA